jgi:hypothetical protein
MKSLSLIVAMSVLLGSVVFVMAQTESKEVLSAEPAVTLKDALSLAEQYVAKEKIDVSLHYLESIRLVPIPDNPKGEKQWLATWILKTPSDGGQVFIHVKMDKSVSKTGGL